MGNVAAPESLWLPPHEFQLRDPHKWEDLVLPEEYTDERGLIEPYRLIQAVKSSIDPAYDWPQKLSVHHLYWPANWYFETEGPEQPGNPRKFRELPIHKALLPRVFENWLHLITVPPDVPDPEVRQHRMEAWSVAKDLFSAARETMAHERKSRRRIANVEKGVITPKAKGDPYGEEWIVDEFIKNFRGLGYLLERHENVPPEFRLVDLDAPFTDVARQLGKVVMPKSLKLTRTASQAA